MSDDSKNVIPLRALEERRASRQPQLTDAELIAIRTMLAEFEVIARSCPTARNLLDRE
jgi:hypothetical protein